MTAPGPLLLTIPPCVGYQLHHINILQVQDFLVSHGGSGVASILGNWCMAMPGVGSIVMPADVMGGVAGNCHFQQWCWRWFVSVNIGMIGNVDGSGSIPNGVGVVTVGGSGSGGKKGG